MEWQVELLKALVEMVKTGGAYAIWGIVAWWVFNLLKIGGILCFLAYLVKCLVRFFQDLVNRHYNNQQQQNNSKHLELLDVLTRSFQESQNTTTQAMKEFLKEAEDLLTQLKNSKENGSEQVD